MGLRERMDGNRLRPEQTLEVEGIGPVLLRGASAGTAARVVEMMQGPDGKGAGPEAAVRAMATLSVACLLDPDTRERVYADNEVDVFLELPMSAVEAIGEAALELANIGGGHEEGKGD